MNLMSILTRRGYFKIIERGIVIESNALPIIHNMSISDKFFF